MLYQPFPSHWYPGIVQYAYAHRHPRLTEAEDFRMAGTRLWVTLGRRLSGTHKFDPAQASADLKRKATRKEANMSSHQQSITAWPLLSIIPSSIQQRQA